MFSKSRIIPANCSRYFDNLTEAISQPTAYIKLAVDSSKSFVFNSEFNSALIMHDKNYCTDNPFQLQYSFDNFVSLRSLLPKELKVIDIGCGQGEFVASLKMIGINATGFDPVLRYPNNYLYKEYFNPDLKRINQLDSVYTFRCVLPHIQNPFDFLNKIFEISPNSLCYIEFQDGDFIADNKIWSQISHDHVNYFNTNSFDLNFNVISKGFFSNNEWGYVLISKEISKKSYASKKFSPELLNLNNSVDDLVKKFVAKCPKSIVIYGGAGKGMLLAWELRKRGLEISIIDENSSYWGKYLDCSGAKIYSPTEYLNTNFSEGIILSNPKHENFFTQKYGQFNLLKIYD